MNLIKIKDLIGVRFTIQADVNSIYQRLKDVFGENNIYSFFAQPNILDSRDKIAWQSDLSGTFTTYTALSESDKRHADYLIQQQVSQLRTLIDTQGLGNDWHQLLENCLNIPEYSDIYLFRSPSRQEQIVLTRWGFKPDKPGADDNILRRIIYARHFDMTLRVAYLDTPSVCVPHKPVSVTIGNNAVENMTTNAEGCILLNKIRAETPIKVVVQNELNEQFVTKEFVCYNSHTETVLIPRYVARFADIHVLLRDQFNNPLPNIPFSFTWAGKTETFTSTESGEIVLKNIKEKESIVAFQPQEGLPTQRLNTHDFVCDPDNPVHTIVLETQPVTFKFVNRKKEPLEGVEARFKYNGKETVQRSNIEGIVVLNDIISHTAMEVKAQKDKLTGKKKIPNIQQGDIHQVTLTPNRWWLWLLWLLPFLILLIPFEQRLNVLVQDTKDHTPIEKASVAIKATSASGVLAQEQLTDSIGKAAFSFGKSPLYKILFGGSIQGNLLIHKGCYATDSMAISGYLGLNSDITVNLQAATTDAQFVVRNSKTNNVLPDAEVKVIIKAHNGKIDSMGSKTDLNGVVKFKDLPACADVTLIASKLEYADTTLLLKMANMGGKDTTIRLRPLGESITFFVQTVLSPNSGLPGATIVAKIECISGNLTESNTVPKTISGRVNTEGAFDLTLCPSANIVLTVSMAGYFDTTWVGKMPDVRTFSKPQRTVKLRAKFKPLTINVIDATSNAPIPNAKVVMTCNGSDLPPERFTDASGIVQVPVDPGCELHIKASKDGDYEPNEQTVKMSDANGKVTIPLKPIIKEQDLEIIVKDGATGLFLKDATVEIANHGSFKTDNNGHALAPRQAIGSSLNITASYPTYESHTVTHKCCDKVVIELFPKVKICSSGLLEGHAEIKVEVWDLKQEVNSCDITYDMESIEDELQVYEGFDRLASGRMVHTTGFVRGRTNITINFSKPSRYVTVKIIGNTQIAGTTWRYQVNCP